MRIAPRWLGLALLATGLGAQDRAEAIAGLRAALDDPSRSVSATVFALHNLRPTADEALPLFLRMLDLPGDSAKGYGLLGIAGLGREARSATPALAALVSPAASEYVRREALLALIAVGADDVAIAPQLVALLEDPVAGAGCAAPALTLLARMPAAATPGVLAVAERRIGDDDTEIAFAALRTAGVLRGEPDPGLAADRLPGADPGPLVAALTVADARRSARAVAVLRGDGRASARCLALWAVTGLDAWDGAVTSAVLEAIVDGDAVVARHARRALLGEPRTDASGIRPGPGVAAAIAVGLADDRTAVRTAAAQAVVRLGPDAAEVAPALAAMLGVRTDLAGLEAGLDAARALGGAAAGCGTALVALLDPRHAAYAGLGHDAAQQLRARTFATLAAVGVPAAARVHLLETLANPDPSYLTEFAAAARAAGAARAAFLVPDLAQALDPAFPDAVVDFRRFAVRMAPKGAGAGAAPLPPDAITARIEAIRSLAAIGAGAAPVLPRLDALAASGVPGAGNSALVAAESASAAAAIRAAPPTPSPGAKP